MNLKKDYFKDKNKGDLTPFSRALSTFIAVILVISGLFWVTQSLWNFVAPIWGLPSLSYLQVVGNIVLLRIIITCLFGLIKIKKNNSNQAIIKNDRKEDE